jgi:small GTP-binding protein
MKHKNRIARHSAISAECNKSHVLIRCKFEHHPSLKTVCICDQRVTPSTHLGISPILNPTSLLHQFQGQNFDHEIVFNPARPTFVLFLILRVAELPTAVNFFHRLPSVSMTSFKVVFLGEGRVGKTSIGRRWAEDRFDQTTRSTVAAAFFQKSTTTKDGRTINIMLWDTAGQEEYHSLAPIYYKDAHAALLVFSCIDQGSFDCMIQWKNELVSSRGEDIKLVVVANKIDVTKDRCIKSEQGEGIAQTINAQYFEVSAKTGQGIDLLFAHVAEILSKLPTSSPALARRSSRVGLQVVNGEEQPKGKVCC